MLEWLELRTVIELPSCFGHLKQKYTKWKKVNSNLKGFYINMEIVNRKNSQDQTQNYAWYAVLLTLELIWTRKLQLESFLKETF